MCAKLREFFHRFTSLLKFSKVHRDSLDEFAHLSDQAAKAMVASLLDLLLADAKEDDQEVRIIRKFSYIDTILHPPACRLCDPPSPSYARLVSRPRSFGLSSRRYAPRYPT